MCIDWSTDHDAWLVHAHAFLHMVLCTQRLEGSYIMLWIYEEKSDILNCEEVVLKLWSIEFPGKWYWTWHRKNSLCLYVLSQIRPTGDSATNDQIQNISAPTENPGTASTTYSVSNTYSLIFYINLVLENQMNHSILEN